EDIKPPAAAPLTSGPSRQLSAQDRLRKARASEKTAASETAPAEEHDDLAVDAFADAKKGDARRRAELRRLYVKLDKTQEWVENNYYRLPIAQQNAQLVTVNGFWNDLAAHDPDQPFY
ncbi:MAG: hypothetical protein GTO03_03775, partial [Planctomycetales bacterium]|nr:hypothetical protein [Planctomycetales bacterium]